MARLGRSIPRRPTEAPVVAATDTGPGSRFVTDAAPAVDAVTRTVARARSVSDTAAPADAVTTLLALNPDVPHPTLPVFEDGDVPTADELGAYTANLRTLWTALHSQIRTEQRPITIVRVTRDNAEAANDTLTALKWDVADVDTGRMFTGVAFPHLAVESAGIYLLGVQVVAGPAAVVAGAVHRAWITVNGGSTGLTGVVAAGVAPQSSATGVLATTEVALSKGDLVRFWFRHNQGGTIPIATQWGGTRAWAVWLAPLDDDDVVADPDPGTGGGGGGGGGGTFTTPGDCLNIGPDAGQNHFNVGIGYSPGDDPQGESGAVHRDFTEAQIDGGFADAGYFELNAGSTAVKFSAHLDGGKTSANTSYPRTELREFRTDGTTRADWNGASGTHYMEGKSKITLGAGLTKPWVCFAQIHDAESDVMRIQTEGTNLSNLKIVMRSTPPGGSETSTIIKSSYTNGTELAWRLEVNNGAGKVFLDGAQVATFNCATTGCYFKAGAYAQTNSTIDNPADGPIVVELRDLVCWHTGYPTPSRPGDEEDPDPGGETGGGSSIVPASATLVSTLNYDTGNYSQWGTIQNKSYNGSASGWSGSSYPAQIVNDGTGHATASRYEVRSGDVAAGGERSEARAGSAHDVVEGDERYYVFSIKFGDGFPAPTGGWCIVMQWHAGDGSPPLALQVNSSKQLYIGNNRPGETWSATVGSIDAGTWHDYVIHAKFSSSASTGFVRVWRDGTEVVPKTFRKTMASSSNYLKHGLYRGAMSATQVIYHDGLKIYRP